VSQGAKAERPSLDEFIAALPVCPDCGEKLHRYAYCPGKAARLEAEKKKS
jgi:hypothetical protein